ncbi:MAG: sigma-70 family RNA polymerase sigma factor [Paenibacillus macerans]|uniref:sigma-70 family RNA polymerase sigma factor n=1 Tax=Paenibacillus macerans TaxID=44252 RepID=UPI00290FA351|nr:sigma-70 family RNA polymerase sigma factor [Paenibacillus macerans]MDU7472326.1 sigma-70 family RNA polymerase sigma factor [Paenibacillus macerans]
MQGIDLIPWLQKLREGDEEAFRYVYDATVQDVYRIVALLIPRGQDIEDIMNEVYIQLWTSLANYDPERPFRYWLHGIVVRQVQDWKRKMWRKFRLFERHTLLEVKEEAPGTDRYALMNETGEEMRKILQRLSYKLRIVIVLRYYHEYSIAEIAQLLNLPEGTVKSRHHLALKELRKYSLFLSEDKGGDCFVH